MDIFKCGIIILVAGIILLLIATKAFIKKDGTVLTYIGTVLTYISIVVTIVGILTSIFGWRMRDDVPEGSAWIEKYNGHKYCICARSDVSSFQEAKRICEEKGGHLAVINDEDENKFLYNTYFRDHRYKSAYFGYTCENDGETWYWVDFSEVTYENWADGEPYCDKDGEFYALFWEGDPDYTWNSGDFGADKGTGVVNFLIEWE